MVDVSSMSRWIFALGRVGTEALVSRVAGALTEGRAISAARELADGTAPAPSPATNSAAVVGTGGICGADETVAASRCPGPLRCQGCDITSVTKAARANPARTSR